MPERTSSAMLDREPGRVADHMTVRVLIVDDRAPFRQAERAVVELADGFEVAGEAESGEASIDLSRQVRPDLVLMDVHLHGMDGLEAARRIRADAAAERAPRVLLLSTYEADDYARLASECGAIGYLCKSELDADVLAAIWEASTGAGV
jgi:two-component system, NarL family, invasion response regulator UvrY